MQRLLATPLPQGLGDGRHTPASLNALAEQAQHQLFRAGSYAVPDQRTVNRFPYTC